MEEKIIHPVLYVVRHTVTFEFHGRK